MVISTEEYDKAWELTDLIANATAESGNPKLLFKGKDNFPTVEEMEEHHVAEHLDFFFPYLMFYYNNKLNTDDPEYLKSFAYIRDLINKNVDFEDVPQ